MSINAEDLNYWETNGLLCLKRFFSAPCIKRVLESVHDMETRCGDTPWMSHYEEVNGIPQLCRVEDFIFYQAELKAMIIGEKLIGTVSKLLREDACLYKEKINFKLPGGAGYSPHQDAPAYPHIKHHITCMVALDSSTKENGCLEFAKAQHMKGLLPMNDEGCLTSDMADTMSWEPCDAEPGDVVFFSSLTPHRSGLNKSSRPRRSLYLTYNALSEGDLRARYYEEKKQTFEKGHSNQQKTRLSLIGHFQGKAAK